MSDSFADFKQRRFLIIDDFNGMRSMLRELLRECGATRVDQAANGKEASDALAHTRFDVVLCDYNLGSGKNGQQLLEEAKVRNWLGPASAWVMITAEKNSDAVLGAVEYQPDLYLLKPITAATLQNRLAKVWAKKLLFQDIDTALAKKDYASALLHCDRQLAVDKVNANELLRWKSQILLALGNTAGARQVYEQALAVREVAWARVGLAKLHYQAGDYVTAQRQLQAVLEEQRTYLEAYDWLTLTLQKLGEDEQAEATLRRAVQLFPNSPQRQKNLGEIALRRGDVEAAEQAFRKSISAGEHSVLKAADAYIGLAHVCTDQGKGSEALHTLGKMGKHFDDTASQLRAKAAEGMVYQKSGQPAKARETARELSTLLNASGTGGSAALGLEASELLLATGDKDTAVALLQEMVKNNHEDQALLAQAQQVFEQAGMGEEGAQLLEVSRRQVMALMNEGVMLAREGKLDEAVAAMRRAKTALPSNARVLFNCAYLMVSWLEQRGDDPAMRQEARDTLLRANEIAPGDARFATLMSKLQG